MAKKRRTAAQKRATAKMLAARRRQLRGKKGSTKRRRSAPKRRTAAERRTYRRSAPRRTSRRRARDYEYSDADIARIRKEDAAAKRRAKKAAKAAAAATKKGSGSAMKKSSSKKYSRSRKRHSGAGRYSRKARPAAARGARRYRVKYTRGRLAGRTVYRRARTHKVRSYNYTRKGKRVHVRAHRSYEGFAMDNPLSGAEIVVGAIVGVIGFGAASLLDRFVATHALTEVGAAPNGEKAYADAPAAMQLYDAQAVTAPMDMKRWGVGLATALVPMIGARFVGSGMTKTTLQFFGFGALVRTLGKGLDDMTAKLTGKSRFGARLYGAEITAINAAKSASQESTAKPAASVGLMGLPTGLGACCGSCAAGGPCAATGQMSRGGGYLPPPPPPPAQTGGSFGPVYSPIPQGGGNTDTGAPASGGGRTAGSGGVNVDIPPAVPPAPPKLVLPGGPGKYGTPGGSWKHGIAGVAGVPNRFRSSNDVGE